jgi:hypothetical protein
MITKNTKKVATIEAEVNGITAKLHRDVIRAEQGDLWVDLWLTPENKENGIVILRDGIYKSSGDNTLDVNMGNADFNLRMFSALTAVYEVYNELNR